VDDLEPREEEEVRVSAAGRIAGQGTPPGGWPGRIVKVTPRRAHIRFGERGTTGVFDRRTQLIRFGNIACRFRAVAQAAIHARRSTALQTLPDAGIRLENPSQFPVEHAEALAVLATAITQPGGGSESAVTKSAIPAGASSPEFLGRLLSAASDAQADAIRDAAVKAGMLWRCACGWYNPEEAAQCEAGDPCRAPRPPRSAA
jgi:hypothetical protein